jgi:hypothetical protein
LEWLLHLPGKMTEQQTIDVESQIQVARGVFILLFMAAWRNLSLLVGTQRDPTHWHPPAPFFSSQPTTFSGQ